MNDLSLEWIAKAEEDFESLNILAGQLRPTLYATIGFHAQQTVEKYFKALLTENTIYFGKTHDLANLIQPLLPLYPELELHLSALKKLTEFAASYRYPGEYALDRNSANDAQAIASDVRLLVRRLLDIK